MFVLKLFTQRCLCFRPQWYVRRRATYLVPVIIRTYQQHNDTQNAWHRRVPVSWHSSVVPTYYQPKKTHLDANLGNDRCLRTAAGRSVWRARLASGGKGSLALAVASLLQSTGEQPVTAAPGGAGCPELQAEIPSSAFVRFDARRCPSAMIRKANYRVAKGLVCSRSCVCLGCAACCSCSSGCAFVHDRTSLFTSWFLKMWWFLGAPIFLEKSGKSCE